MEVTKFVIVKVISLICAVIVVCIHEYPRIISYKYLVHPLYRKESQNSFNPLKYMDPFGIISFVFLGVGWQKPFYFNTGRLKDKKKGLLSITLIGLLCNLLVMAILIPIYFSILDTNVYLVTFVYNLMLYNIVIVIVNILPVPPFDMVKIIQALNPQLYFKFIQYEKVIQALFILVVASGYLLQISSLILNSILSIAI